MNLTQRLRSEHTQWFLGETHPVGCVQTMISGPTLRIGAFNIYVQGNIRSPSLICLANFTAFQLSSGIRCVVSNLPGATAAFMIPFP